MSMREKVALVTGGGGDGIGRAIAVGLAREGIAVVVADINEEGGRETMRQVEENGGRAAFVLADVTAEGDVREMVTFAEGRFGGLDVLVNNAGGVESPCFPNAEPAHWGRALDLNLRGVMLGIQFGLQAMRKRGGGTIVNIASMAGIGYRPYTAPEYAASKAGVVRLTAALGRLKEDLNVRVNCICPGWVATPAVKRYLAETPKAELEKLEYPPPPVLIQPEQIADAVITFIRDDSLAGRVMLWPDGEPWRLVPVDASI